MIWNSIPRPWQVCLEEAWTAYCAGSLPIGACITDAKGNILARGRNRIHETDGEAPYVFNDTLAHAELNTLLALDTDHDTRHTSTLYTTTEPCPMCLGAFYMSGIRTLRYAAREPFAGSINLLGTTPYLSRKPIQIFGPSDTALEILVTALAVERDLFYRCNANNIVIQAWREVIPSGVVVGEKLHQTGTLRQMQAEGCTAERLFESISEIISP